MISMQAITEMLNSILTYFSAFNWDEFLASVQLIISNIDVETFRNTVDVLKDFLSSLGSMLG